MLGLIVNTHKLTVSIPGTYVLKVLLLLNNTWHPGRKQFMVLEAQKLTGKLGHLAEGATWIFHLLSHLYTLMAYVLSKNKRLLFKSSKKFQTLFCHLKGGLTLEPPKKKLSIIMLNKGITSTRLCIRK
jgi:hypothetical protein